MTLKLEDLVPEYGEFHLAKMNKTYRLRPCTLADESWMQRTWGKEVELIFKEVRMPELSRIAFRLMEPEQKLDFQEQEVTVIDDETGKVSKQTIGGAPLFQHCIVGQTEKVALLQALMQTIGLSRPAQEKIMEDGAKQAAAEEKKSVEAPKSSAGPKSSTSSAPSTDGPQSTSSAEP